MAYPGPQDTAQVCLREWDEPIETLSTDRPDYPLADRIRRRTARRALQYSQPEAAHRAVQAGRKDAIAIVEQIAVSAFVAQRLT
jgi:hypothetical protein